MSVDTGGADGTGPDDDNSIPQDGKIRRLLRESGLSAQNMTVGLVIHEALGVSLLFGGWYLGYRILLTPRGRNAISQIYARSLWLRRVRDKTAPDQLKAHRWVRKLPPTWSTNVDLKVAGFINGAVARKVLAPVLIPTKIFVAVGTAKWLLPSTTC